MAYNADTVIALYWNNDDPSIQISSECPPFSFYGIFRPGPCLEDEERKLLRMGTCVFSQEIAQYRQDFEDDSCMSISSTAI